MIRLDADTETLNFVVNYRRIIVDKLPSASALLDYVFIHCELRLYRTVLRQYRRTARVCFAIRVKHPIFIEFARKINIARNRHVIA